MQPLRVLIVEDSADDAALLLRELKRAGYQAQHERVDTLQALQSALARQSWDVIFADFSMPKFSGTQALAAVRERGLDVPFIFVSGTIGEDTAVAAMKAGAQDYIMKDNLKRLMPAVERELREADVRRGRARAEQELALLRATAQAAADAPEVTAALRAALERIGPAVGAIAGCAWVVSDDHARLEAGAVWHGALGQVQLPFAGDRYTCGRGEGRAGRVWAEGQMVWEPAAAAAEDALSALALPVAGDDGLSAVLELYFAAGVAPDERAQQLLRSVAAQLGPIVLQKRSDERLQYLTQHDALTHLPNRALLYERLKQAIYDATRDGRLVALLLLDLDHFKRINDSLGHAAGDECVRLIAARLAHTIRRGDTVARLGSDEFAVVLAHLAQLDDVARITRKISDAVSQPVTLAGRELFLTSSVGIALYPFDGKHPDALLKNAESAMYRAKDQRNSHQFYAPDMGVQSRERLTLDTGLRRALEREEFVVHYQPLVELNSGRIVGVEALVRWQNPHGGVIGPAQFIAAAEENGLIVPLGEWVLRQVCLQQRAWRAAGLPALRIGVNLSPRQLLHPGLTRRVLKILADTGVEPSAIDLEITEGVLLNNTDAGSAVLRELAAAGLQCSIDDFGTGYSSLSYIKHLPVDRLKIDQSFVRDVGIDKDNAAIVTAVITLARSLGMEVVAEGVENDDQVEFLRRHECDLAQGFAFGRPVPPVELARLLPAGPVPPIG